MDEQKKFHQKLWFTWVMLFIFTPIGIFSLWKNKHYSKTVNIALSIILGIFFICVASSNNPDESKVATTRSAPVTKATIKASLAPTIPPTPAPTLTQEQIAKQAAKKEKEKYQKWIDNQFSAWDGSHKSLVDLITENLNDADSFEHVKTTYIDNGDGLTIFMTYRAKNAFGAKILQNVTATSDYKTNYIKVISQNN
jgi:hypothetical protein